MSQVQIPDNEVIFQLFNYEGVLNGYYHLVQKKIHGGTKPYVGIKSFHIGKAIELGVPIMIHLCPDVELEGLSSYDKLQNLRKCTFKNQTEVMILQQKDFYNFFYGSMSKDEEGNVIEFGKNKYQVWHYYWKPHYVEGKGIIKRDDGHQSQDYFL